MGKEAKSRMLKVLQKMVVQNYLKQLNPLCRVGICAFLAYSENKRIKVKTLTLAAAVADNRDER